MEIFKKPVKTKTIAWFILIPTSLLFLSLVVLVLFIPAFGFASGVSFVQMIPFFFLTFAFLIFATISIYVSMRYFKNKPFAENQTLGLLFVVFSIGYFLYNLLACILSNLTGNIGGYFPTILAFLLLFILLPLGLGLKNGYK